jgi:ATP-dependent HslUV protease, peptidase subunit HslV
MTTLVVVKKAGYVAIAGDSLTTFGGVKLLPEYDKSHDKILHANGTYFGIAGSAAHHLVMESILSKNTEMKLGSKMEIFETFRKIHPVLKEEHFLNPKEEEDDPYESSQLTSLIANKAGIASGLSARDANSRWAQCSPNTTNSKRRKKLRARAYWPAVSSTPARTCR